jgi:hypothetical protein
MMGVDTPTAMASPEGGHVLPSSVARRASRDNAGATRPPFASEPAHGFVDLVHKFGCWSALSANHAGRVVGDSIELRNLNVLPRGFARPAWLGGQRSAGGDDPQRNRGAIKCAEAPGRLSE